MTENDEREFLMIPGPVSVDDEVLEALARPVRAHYGEGWTELYKRCIAGMKKVFKTSGDVHLIFGSGMAGIETCIASVLGPGDEVLVATNGLFGERMAEVATANGIKNLRSIVISDAGVVSSESRPLRGPWHRSSS